MKMIVMRMEEIQKIGIVGFKNIFLTTSRKCKFHESVNYVRESGYQGSR